MDPSICLYREYVTRSVPEKTLEHWASQYITYRYRSKAALWWPARGEDIQFGRLPSRAGKIVQIELKTTEVVRRGVHEVEVDLGQLWEYQRLPLGKQPFYAFPRPGADWPGDLGEAAAMAGLAVSELGYSRSKELWFANWMVVMTTEQVANVLSKELALHGSEKRGERRPLVRFAGTSEPRWGREAADPEVIRWRNFWSTLDRCGRDHWPQLIRLPAVVLDIRDGRELFGGRELYTRQQLRGLLDGAAGTQGDVGPLVILEPNPDGHYRRSDFLNSNSVRVGVAPNRGDTEQNDHRAVVSLDV